MKEVKNCTERNGPDVCQRIAGHEGAHMHHAEVDIKWGPGSEKNLCQWCAWPLYILTNGRAIYCKKCDMINSLVERKS